MHTHTHTHTHTHARSRVRHSDSEVGRVLRYKRPGSGLNPTDTFICEMFIYRVVHRPYVLLV